MVVKVIGAGLAGVEAAHYLANKGIKVKLYEMRPKTTTPAHQTGLFAELVCSNSFRSKDPLNAIGILKSEMEKLNSIVMRSAYLHEVEAGSSLAVDRTLFASYITDVIKAHPNIEIINEEVIEIDVNEPTIIAAGPLVSNGLKDNLLKLFNDRYSVAFHGDVRLFYNREKVYDKMYGFDNFHYFDPTEPYFEETQNGFWLFPDHVHTNLPNKVWLTENDLLEWLKIAYISTSENKGEKGFYYPILMNPHTPFLYNPTKEENLRFKKGDIDISEETRRYLNYETYMESFFNKFIEISYELKDTVYIFYGDHGSGIPEKDYYAIMGLSANSNNAAKLHFEYQQEMLKTIAFIYVPDDDAESLDIKPGLFKGVQKRVRSQVDIYRTIIELFDLQTNNYYFGVNLLSKEHTFAIDTKHFNIITDDYFIIGKKMIKDINYKDAYRVLSDDPKKDVVELYKYVLRFKNKLDHAIKENAYQYLKND
jgi:lipoteichoic acid synthase